MFNTYFHEKVSPATTEEFLDPSNVEFFEMHDGKFFYEIMQCSKWNQKYHPFPKCKCKRGEAFKN